MTSDQTPDQVPQAVTSLRRTGDRVTPARVAVLEVLAGTREHLTADEIADLATARAPGAHRATVYRALSRLGELGLVTHTHVGGAAAVYHLAAPDAETPAHPHLQCTTCGSILDLPGDALAPLTARVEAELGFRLQPEHAALLGTCERCR